MVEVNDDVFFNILKDFQKRNISTEDKGKLVRAYMDENNISQRELARRLGVPHSTLHDWTTGRQLEKYHKAKYDLDFLLDRLLFIITRKEYKITDKTKKLLTDLKYELNLVQLEDKNGKEKN